MFVVGRLDRIKYSRLMSSKYKAVIVHSVSTMENKLNSLTPDLIILDIDLIRSCIDRDIIQSVNVNRMIPVILLVNNQHEALESIDLGYSDFFIKPVIPELFIHRIDVYMQSATDLKMSMKMNVKIHDKLKEKTEEFIRLQSGIIGVLSEAIEFRDFDTESHNLRTQSYMEILIKKMLECPNKYKREIVLWDVNAHILSSQLHDIGKIGIPDEILLKVDPLTPEEFERIKEHVVIGERIIDKILKQTGENAYLEIARKYISSHHEFWNGKGYPHSLSGTDIPLEGRILAVVDVYDALTSARPYKNQESHNGAVAIINANSGTQFDPEIVRIFDIVSDKFKEMHK